MKKRCQKLGETVSLNWRKNHWTIIRICIWLQGVIDTADSDSAVSVPSPCLTTPSFNSSWRPLLYNRLFSQSAFYMRKEYWTCTRVAFSEVVRKSVLWHGKMEKGKNWVAHKKGKKKKRKEKGNMAVRDPSTVDIGAVDWTIIEIKCSITICRRKEAVVFKICYQEMKKNST